MVKVQVRVNNLAIDLDGEEMKFRQGDVFECPAERAKKLGNSVMIWDDIPPVVLEQEFMPPDEPKRFKRKAAGPSLSIRRNEHLRMQVWSCQP